MVIAAKYHEDEYYTNSHYAFIGGVTLNEFNVMELSFVKLLGFKFFVALECYEKYWNQLIASYDEMEWQMEELLALKEGAGNGGKASKSTSAGSMGFENEGEESEEATDKWQTKTSSTGSIEEEKIPTERPEGQHSGARDTKKGARGGFVVVET